MLAGPVFLPYVRICHTKPPSTVVRRGPDLRFLLCVPVWVHDLASETSASHSELTLYHLRPQPLDFVYHSTQHWVYDRSLTFGNSSGCYARYQTKSFFTLLYRVSVKAKIIHSQ